MSPLPLIDSLVNLSFNVPFASSLPGPNVNEILHASPGAFQKWTHPEGSEDDTPIHKLPVHTRNVEYLRELCKEIGKHTGGRVEATVTCSEPKPVLPAVQRRSLKGLITNVCVSGDGESVPKMRARILNQTPIALVSFGPRFGARTLADKYQKCAVVDIDTKYVVDATLNGIKVTVLEHIDKIAKFTGSDIFLLNSKPADPEGPTASYANGTDQTLDQRLRIAIYGDPESSEHAKMRVLIMIDQIVHNHRLSPYPWTATDSTLSSNALST